jgi:hypothetical protein
MEAIPEVWADPETAMRESSVLVGKQERLGRLLGNVK